MSAVLAGNGFNPDSFMPPANSPEAFIKQHVPQDDDSGVIARFYKRTEENTFKTKETGVYVEQTVDYINMVVRGNDKMEVDRPVLPEDKRRFPYLWQQYQLGRQAEQRGTGLDLLPGGITPREIQAFNALNIFTIEDLALVSDMHIGALGTGARERRARAQAFVKLKSDKTESDRRVEELLVHNKQLGDQLKQALDAAQALASRLDKLEAAQAQTAAKKGKAE